MGKLLTQQGTPKEIQEAISLLGELSQIEGYIEQLEISMKEQKNNPHMKSLWEHLNREKQAIRQKLGNVFSNENSTKNQSSNF